MRPSFLKLSFFFCNGALLQAQKRRCSSPLQATTLWLAAAAARRRTGRLSTGRRRRMIGRRQAASRGHDQPCAGVPPPSSSRDEVVFLYNNAVRQSYRFFLVLVKVVVLAVADTGCICQHCWNLSCPLDESGAVANDLETSKYVEDRRVVLLLLVVLWLLASWRRIGKTNKCEQLGSSG